ncbi:MAG TPA: dihydrodipicolinate synthase family protein [Dehalococcoidia bacterium]|nr:dihydrodipicolinate synthase family protein [Dehalococcoidia bacterium]
MELDLGGLVPAVVTPMHKDGRVDDEALRDYARWLLAFDGLKAVAVNMDTGEGPQLFAHEQRRVLGVWLQEADGRVPVLAGVGGHTDLACDMARDAMHAGVSGVVVFPHPVFAGEPQSPDVIYEHNAAIAKATGLPTVVFQLQPSLGGVLFSRETLLRLASIPNVVAIKEASFDAVRFVETVRALQDAPHRLQILTGNDNFILESFMLGADGALIGFGTLAVAEQIEMIRRYKAGDLTGARQIYDNIVQPLVSAVFAAPVRNYRARTKEALCALGVIGSAAVRRPLLPLDEGEKQRVREAVQRANLATQTAAA